jgi:protein SCO1/2
MLYPRSIAHLVAFVIALCAFAMPALSRAADGAPAVAAEPADGKPVIPPGLEDVGVDEHLDAQIPLDTVFRDSTGRMVKLGDLFDGKRPVVLTLAYHTCPTVCSMVLSQTVESMKQVDWSIGKDYRAITLSFDPRETTARTAEKRTQLLAQYGRPGADPGWTFLTGDDTNIHRVTDAVGFKYHYVEREQQYAHATVIMILKPNGQVARYLYGLEYAPKDVKLGLLEASNGRSISTVDRILLYCYHYDANGGRYVIVATRVMQVGGGLCGLALLAFLGSFWLKELVKSRREKKSGAASPSPKIQPAAH